MHHPAHASYPRPCSMRGSRPRPWRRVIALTACGKACYVRSDPNSGLLRVSWGVCGLAMQGPSLVRTAYPSYRWSCSTRRTRSWQWRRLVAVTRCEEVAYVRSDPGSAPPIWGSVECFGTFVGRRDGSAVHGTSAWGGRAVEKLWIDWDMAWGGDCGSSIISSISKISYDESGPGPEGCRWWIACG